VIEGGCSDGSKPGVGSPRDGKRFESTVLIHLDAAYNLARWLTRNERDAEDVVQEACLRALKYLDGFKGGNSRAWFLAIVRNTYYSDLRKNRAHALDVPLDGDELFGDDIVESAWAANEDLSRSLEREDARRVINEALDRLPQEFREVIVLRELEELSYQEIARVAEIPLGTVMSRLSRARKFLCQELQRAGIEEGE
jgi:RNA polymerase sigma-70 factor, ECF subfamily